MLDKFRLKKRFTDVTVRDDLVDDCCAVVRYISVYDITSCIHVLLNHCSVVQITREFERGGPIDFDV